MKYTAAIHISFHEGIFFREFDLSTSLIIHEMQKDRSYGLYCICIGKQSMSSIQNL